MPQVTVDLVSERPDGTFVIYLVEQGPWTSDPITHLRSIQDRLYGYFDVAVDGHLANLYPASSGRPVVIRVDAYDTPPQQVASFVQHFSEMIAGSMEHRGAVQRSSHIASLAFECEEKPLENDEPAASLKELN
jgi:Family of unknown function (DUF6572)